MLSIKVSQCFYLHWFTDSGDDLSPGRENFLYKKKVSHSVCAFEREKFSSEKQNHHTIKLIFIIDLFGQLLFLAYLRIFFKKKKQTEQHTTKKISHINPREEIKKKNETALVNEFKRYPHNNRATVESESKKYAKTVLKLYLRSTKRE